MWLLDHNLPRQLTFVLQTLPQQRGTAYAKAFEEAWTRSRIAPVAGKLIRWPA